MQVMEAPVRVLRGLAASAGKIIGVADRRKAKTAPTAVTETATPETVEATAPQTVETETTTSEASGNVKLVTPETDAPETVDAPAAETTVPEAAVAEAPAPEAEAAAVTKPTKPAPRKAAKSKAAEPKAAEPKAAEPVAAADLPLANYDELAVNSLRARMTKLNPDQLTVLIDYEKAHQGRDEVVGMLERRIIRINSGQTTSFQAVK
jgi:hypothetical protein